MIKDIKTECKNYKELSLAQTTEFRDSWKNNFAKKDTSIPMHHCSNCKDFKKDDMWGLDWHGLSYAGIESCPDYLEAIKNVPTKEDEDIIVFEEDCGSAAIAISFSDLKQLLNNNKDKRFMDIYFTPKDFSWTLVLTHEDGWIGPFFVRK
jgi:hypothetical protein